MHLPIRQPAPASWAILVNPGHSQSPVHFEFHNGLTLTDDAVRVLVAVQGTPMRHRCCHTPHTSHLTPHASHLSQYAPCGRSVPKHCRLKANTRARARAKVSADSSLRPAASCQCPCPSRVTSSAPVSMTARGGGQVTCLCLCLDHLNNLNNPNNLHLNLSIVPVPEPVPESVPVPFTRYSPVNVAVTFHHHGHCRQPPRRRPSIQDCKTSLPSPVDYSRHGPAAQILSTKTT